MKKPRKTDTHAHPHHAPPKAGGAKRPPMSPAVRALVETIRATLNGPVTARSLRSVAEFAEIGERILFTERSAAAGLGAPSRRPRGSASTANIAMPNGLALSSGFAFPTSNPYGGEDDDGLPTTPAYASAPETWATRMMREIVSMFAAGRSGGGDGAEKVDMEGLVRAIAAARSLGQTELADKLERRLVPQVPPPVLPPIVAVTAPTAVAPRAKRAKRAK